jgi:hypothetical protein
MTIKRISLVIPATPGDAILLPELLRAINQESVVPHEVIISILSGKDVPPALLKAIEAEFGQVCKGRVILNHEILRAAGNSIGTFGFNWRALVGRLALRIAKTFAGACVVKLDRMIHQSARFQHIHYPLKQVLSCLRQDLEYMRQSGLTANGIELIKQENSIATLTWC